MGGDLSLIPSPLLNQIQGKKYVVFVEQRYLHTSLVSGETMISAKSLDTFTTQPCFSVATLYNDVNFPLGIFFPNLQSNIEHTLRAGSPYGFGDKVWAKKK